MINRRVIDSFRKHRLFFKGIAIFGAYALWIAFFRLLVLTFITYFVISSSPSGPLPGKLPKYEDINEAFSASEPGIMALGSFIFVFLIPFLNPLTRTSFRDIFTPERFEKRFLTGFAQGAVFACGVVLAFLISGTYRYLGFFIHFEDTSFAIGNVLLRFVGLGAFAYCEEFIFREKILGYVKGSFEKLLKNQLAFKLLVATGLSLLYCGAKSLQFDLGLMQLLTLFLISFSLSLRVLDSPVPKDFSNGAGFLAALLITFHPLLSLPVFGSDFSGLILVKYQAGLLANSEVSTLSRLFTGGQGGPLSSVALQLLFLFDIARYVARYRQTKKIPLNAASYPLK